MIGSLQTFALDCPDPTSLAAFYADLLGGTVVDEEGDNEWVELRGEFGTTLSFQRVDHYLPPEWPGRSGAQQAHIDLGVPDLDDARPKVLALGATLLEDWAGKKTWHVYADPAGHPFCLCAC